MDCCSLSRASGLKLLTANIAGTKLESVQVSLAIRVRKTLSGRVLLADRTSFRELTPQIVFEQSFVLTVNVSIATFE